MGKNVRKIFLFQNISVDGCFEAPGHDISGFNTRDDHFDSFSPTAGSRVDAILFGHRTYDLMKSFWSTRQAAQMLPDIARFMNESQKYVASRSPFDPGWQKVTVLSGDISQAVRSLKEQPGKDIILFGSNTLCVSLLEAGLLDEVQLLVNPFVMGSGSPLFQGLHSSLALRLVDTHAYPSGKVLLTYQPAYKDH